MFRRKGRPRRRVSFSLPWMYDSSRAGVYLLMRQYPLWMRFHHQMPGCSPAMQTPICFYNKALLNCLPGSCRMMPFISRLKSVARTSEEFKPERSTMSSMGFGSSALNNSYSFFSDPLSEAAASRFRCSASGCSAWTSAARTGVGSSSITSSALVTSLAPCLISRLGAKLTGCVTLPGTPKTSLPNSIARRAVISEPLYCAPSMTNSERHPCDDAIAYGKILRCGMSPQREFSDDGSAFENFLIQFLVFLRVANIYARAENSDGAPVRIQSPLMPDGVDTARQAADDHHSTCRKFPAKELRHLRAIECRAARADDAEAGQIENLHIATDVEKNWRVVDLQERSRIFRLRPVQKHAVGNLSNAIQFFFRALEGFLLHHGLRSLRGKIAGFQIRQRRTKDAIGRTKLVQDAGGQTGTQAGRERQREPGEGCT